MQSDEIVGVSGDAAVETTLAGIYADVLEVARIGLDDDFFRLGGNSLLATKLAARIEIDLGVRVPARAFYECSTVASLAPVVAQMRADGDHGNSQTPRSGDN
ncbi:MAG TPA: phosphopantetheine-binding protein [Candidatus Limnocylindrales bacterium]|nr:phosphopantetheine-binding protein [Candidatus Limnocylindrales bacterium]